MLNQILFMAARAADGLPEELPRTGPSKLFGLSVRDILLLLGIVAIIGLTLFLWAYLTRRKHRVHLSRTGRVIERAERRPTSDTGLHERRVRVRKRRRRNSDDLPRNPTLGETGGLPPLRPDEPAQPTT